MTIDFSDVEGRGGKKSEGQQRYKPGDYAVKVKSAKRDVSGQKGTKQIVFEFVFLDGKYKGKRMFHRCNLLPQSLWVFRNTLEAMGVKVPDKRFKVDLKPLVGKKLAITIDDEEYRRDGEKRISSKVTDTFSLKELEKLETSVDEDTELDEDEEEDEEEEDEEEDEEEEDEDEDEDVDEDDLDDI